MNNGTHLTGTHLTHLTDEEIDDYLIGDLAAEPAAHLSACGPCQLRARAMEMPIANFKAVSLAWSERQSATLPLKPEGFPGSSWHHRGLWATTAAAALLVGIAIPVARHRNADTDAVATRIATAAPVTVADVTPSREEQIARDNQMLQAIDRELAASSPSETFGLEAVSSANAGHGRAEQLRN